MSGVSYTARQRLPAAQFATIDGKRMAYAVAGTGRPTVVFVGGAGMGIASWRGVFGGAAEISTAFAYDRLGCGGSARPVEPQTGAAIVTALRSLLVVAGLEPKYVLVGHSLGGLYANLFARTAPDEVAGVVLVDAAHPDEGVDGASANLLPGRVLAGLFGLVDRLRGATLPSEIAELPATRRQLAAAGPFPDVPLAVITGRKGPPGWLAGPTAHVEHVAFQGALAGLAPRSRQIFAERSGHMLQVTEPGVVVAVIREVVEEARS